MGAKRLAVVGMAVGAGVLCGMALVRTETGLPEPPGPLVAGQGLPTPTAATEPPESGGAVRVSAAPGTAAETRTTTPSVPKWLATCARLCGLSEDQVRRVLADPSKMSEGARVWDELSVAVMDAQSAKGNFSARICAERQAKGQYEVYPPEARLPDADPRIGEHIEFRGEPNPKGGTDLVRVIRIYPGDCIEFDQAAQVEASLRATRKAVMIELLK